MEYKNIEVSWLFETDLTNMNAGEGSANLKEIKTYDNGLPYISGQSMRHALRQAMMRENKDKFKCTPEYPCGNIKDCWTCDLFGYLLPSQGAKRWSPIKASPALGQLRNQITTDMIFRMVEDIKCPNCSEKIYPLAARDKGVKNIEQGKNLTCPKCEKEFKAPYDIRQAIAYKQLIKNMYKSSISIDLNNIGIEEVPKITGEGTNAVMDSTEPITTIEEIEKINRIKAILNAIYNLSDFANQSREMVNASPDFVILGLQKQYNHRLASVLKLDEEGNINIKHMESIINDILTMDGSKLFAGYISGVIKNEDELNGCLDKLSSKEEFKLCDNPRDAFNKAIASISGDENGSS